MEDIATVYKRHMNLRAAAAELGIKWQALYYRLKIAGVPVTGDKLRYGSDRDRLAHLAESEFQRLVPAARACNESSWQAKIDFVVRGHGVDVKSSMPRKLNKKYERESWAFSVKKQSFTADFIVCFCMNEQKLAEYVLLIPSEFFAGLQHVSITRRGKSKWLDYSVPPEELGQFFDSLPAKESKSVTVIKSVAEEAYPLPKKRATKK